ncbi:DUF4189 domain-containing protein [Gordonia hydrophobica]|uniref:DUF4189 domain-containing protein n=1 Tax=Gordonia hydrophobica TaxID=40516 RepID=A0ABZ2TY78_9ACTN|nr:DUF4189 domain-containing protein [Gordonia hydrophobica]MBM7366546.1 hypothetical protein [Gordonia hydrophobica]
MKLRQFLAAFAIVGALATVGTALPGVTPTAEAAPGGYWGAISWNYEGRTSYAVNYGSERAALHAAKRRCGSRCGWFTFYRSCGAVAYKFGAYRTRVGTARGYPTRASAQRAAKRKAGPGSHVRGWACTSR